MNGNPNKAGITILITDRSCLQGKHSKNIKECHLHANKGNSSLKDRTIVNIYVSNIVAPDFIK